MPHDWQACVYADGLSTLSYNAKYDGLRGRKRGEFTSSFSLNARAKRVIKRAINGYARVNRTNPVLLTLTTNLDLPDSTFKRYAAQLIKKGSLLHSVFRRYVIVYELTKKGRLHAHILLFNSIPEDVHHGLLELWKDYYQMGNYGFDTKYLKGDLKLASNYLSVTGKYLIKSKNTPRKINNRLFTVSRELRPYALPATVPFKSSIPKSKLSELRDNMEFEDKYYMGRQTNSLFEGIEFFSSLGIDLELSESFRNVLNA